MKRVLSLFLLLLAAPPFAHMGFVGADIGLGHSDTDIKISGGYVRELDQSEDYGSAFLRGGNFFGDAGHLGILYRTGLTYVDEEDADIIRELSCDFAFRSKPADRVELIKALGLGVTYAGQDQLTLYFASFTATLELLYSLNDRFSLYLGGDFDLPLVVGAKDERVSITDVDKSVTGYALRGFAGACYRY